MTRCTECGAPARVRTFEGGQRPGPATCDDCAARGFARIGLSFVALLLVIGFAVALLTWGQP